MTSTTGAGSTSPSAVAEPRPAEPLSLVKKVQVGTSYVVSRLRRGPEADKASSFWGSMRDYHLTNDVEPVDIARSQWLANVVVPELGLSSLLEVGTNSGRNLEHIRKAHPQIELKGIDINQRALAFARAKGLDIQFELADANRWGEPQDRWDGVLTMSVLDHIPDEATGVLARNFAISARHVIAVELFDGSDGTRAVYKYSRNNKALFEHVGFETLTWEVAPHQYDSVKSLLWVYIGRRP
jgi:SAM-dependent methyltransferase